MSASTMRVQPSWANAVAVALPMPGLNGLLLVKMESDVDGSSALTGGGTGD